MTLQTYGNGARETGAGYDAAMSNQLIAVSLRGAEQDGNTEWRDRLLAILKYEKPIKPKDLAMFLTDINRLATRAMTGGDLDEIREQCIAVRNMCLGLAEVVSGHAWPLSFKPHKGCDRVWSLHRSRKNVHFCAACSEVIKKGAYYWRDPFDASAPRFHKDCFDPEKENE